MKTLFTTLFYSLLFSLILSCNNKESNTGSHKEDNNEENDLFVTNAQFNQNNMSLGAPVVKEFPVLVAASGTIDVPPENRAMVTAYMGGYIKKTPFLVGDKVQKGAPLVTIENQDFIILQQEYLEIKEQLSYLQAEYERQNTMMEENITSKKSFLQAESNYKTALAKYKGLQQQLELLHLSPSKIEKGILSSTITIYAPISGSITRVNVSSGAYVSPATPILEIINNDHIHLELSVFEKDILNLKKDQKIQFKIPESSSKTYEAAVHLIGTSIENNRTVKVHGHISNEKEAHFLPGMFVEAEIITEALEGTALPETTFVSDNNNTYYLLLSNKNEKGYYFKKMKANVLGTHKGFTQIDKTMSIKNDQQVLTSGAFTLINGE